jgi:hypothetical protein
MACQSASSEGECDPKQWQRRVPEGRFSTSEAGHPVQMVPLTEQTRRTAIERLRRKSIFEIEEQT